MALLPLLKALQGLLTLTVLVVVCAVWLFVVAWVSELDVVVCLWVELVVVEMLELFLPFLLLVLTCGYMTQVCLFVLICV